MNIIPDSGIFYPNSFVRVVLLSLEDILGKNGVKSILNLANQPGYIENYPPENMNSEFDIAHYSMIIAALDELYGVRGAKILATRAGHAIFKESVKTIGDPFGITSESFQSKPMEEKIEGGLAYVRAVITGKKPAPMPRTDDNQFLFSVQLCPVCWGRTTDTPRCFLTTGLLREAIRWATGGTVVPVTQVKAHSCGDATCDYVIPTQPNN
jgi:predicted hydrocarbon binding protein